MARTALGTHPQAESRTALYAYFAARLAGLPTHRFASAFREWGLRVGADGANRAAGAHKERSATKRRPGRTPPEASGGSTSAGPAAFLDWLLIDERGLGLQVSLATFPGDGRRQLAIRRALIGMPGVRQIIETAHSRDLLVVTLSDGADGRDAMRSKLEELDLPFLWDDIIFETQRPAQDTWRMLARRAAEAEGLLAPPNGGRA